MNDFDPYLQVQNRLRSLCITGNAISKCDVRVIGGTWSVYPREYQEDFIRQIYDAHTDFGQEVGDRRQEIVKTGPFSRVLPPTSSRLSPSSTLAEAKLRNETATSRVIGIAIETRPDWIDEEEIVIVRSHAVARAADLLVSRHVFTEPPCDPRAVVEVGASEIGRGAEVPRRNPTPASAS